MGARSLLPVDCGVGVGVGCGRRSFFVERAMSMHSTYPKPNPTQHFYAHAPIIHKNISPAPAYCGGPERHTKCTVLYSTVLCWALSHSRPAAGFVRIPLPGPEPIPVPVPCNLAFARVSLVLAKPPRNDELPPPPPPETGAGHSMHVMGQELTEDQ